MDKVKQERQVKEEAMSQDEEEDIPVTEKEMSLKVSCVSLNQNDDLTPFV